MYFLACLAKSKNGILSRHTELESSKPRLYVVIKFSFTYDQAEYLYITYIYLRNKNYNTH